MEEVVCHRRRAFPGHQAGGQIGPEALNHNGREAAAGSVDCSPYRQTVQSNCLPFPFRASDIAEPRQSHHCGDSGYQTRRLNLEGQMGRMAAVDGVE